MMFEEIKNYTDNGKVCVAINLMPEYSGFVRKIFFYSRNRVCIEYVGFWVDDSEKGYEFCHTFPSLRDAIESIENYLGKPLDDWINHSKTGEFPEIQHPVNLAEGDEDLRKDILNNKINLPQKGAFKPNFDKSLLD